MSDRKTRKAIKAVINKYAGKNTGKIVVGGFIGAGVGVAALLDLMLTGGITTTVLLTSGAITGSISSLTALSLYKPATETNAAGQTITYDTSFVQIAVHMMQDKLDKAFNKASAVNASKADKTAFIAQAQEITADVRTISPVFNILSGTPADRYEFSVPDGRTLTKALEDMQEPAAEKKKKPAKKEEPRIADLKKFQEQMDALDRIAGKKPHNDGPASP